MFIITQKKLIRQRLACPQPGLWSIPGRQEKLFVQERRSNIVANLQGPWHPCSSSNTERGRKGKTGTIQSAVPSRNRQTNEGHVPQKQMTEGSMNMPTEDEMTAMERRTELKNRKPRSAQAKGNEHLCILHRE